MEDQVEQKKVRVKRSGYIAYQDKGEGVFWEAFRGASIKALRDRIAAEKAEGEFVLVCVRQRLKAEKTETIKLRAA